MFQDNVQLPRPDEILVYLRKSRSDDPLLSVEDVLRQHETLLDEWAERYLDGSIPEENRFREIVSGETIEARPEMQRLLKQIESPKIKAILTVEVQRLSRGDLEDAGRLMKLLRYTETLVITPQKTYDLRDEYDRDFFERELKRGNEYLEYQKKIMNRGRLLSVSQGNYIGSIPPYGYDKTFVMDGKRKCPTLTPNPEEAPVVRTAFEMYVLKDYGPAKICDTFDSLAIKAPNGKPWSRETLLWILKNPHYIGLVCWNRRPTVSVVEDGEIKKTRPKVALDDCLLYPGKHPPLIPEEWFYEAQKKMGRVRRIPRNKTPRNPFASLLYCRCGQAMSLRFQKDSEGKDRCQPRLICNDQKHCHTGSCTLGEVTDFLEELLIHYIADFEIHLKSESDDDARAHARLIERLEKKLKDLETRELEQWEAQFDPDPAKRLPPEIFARLNEKVKAERAELEPALKEARATMPHPVELEAKLKSFRDALDALRDPNADPEALNALLKACILRIEYSRERPERRPPKPKKKSGGGTMDGGWIHKPISLDVKLRL